eukprot:c21471_g1_i1 orf=302-1252(+)
MRRVGAGTAKTLEKLERSVEAGNYYEAQQMYKTVYARYMAAGKYTEAMDLLQSGASVQLKHGQVTCGVELGVLLVETFVKAKESFGSSVLARVKSIFKEFPHVPHQKWESEGDGASEAYIAAKTRVEGCSTFMKAAIKWCIESGGPSRGPAELHDMLAEYLCAESPNMDLRKASFHFVRGSHPDAYAAALVAYMDMYHPEDADLLLAQGVLMYLSLGNLRDANLLVDKVKQTLSGKSQDFPVTPLMHFIKFLLLTLERDAVPLFQMLRENFKSSIGQDPSFDDLLDEIGERFYTIHRRNGLQGMLNDLLKMFATDT